MFFMEFLGCITTVIIIFAANCGGLGGGGALVPVVMVFFNFDIKASIALSNITILFSSYVRMIMNRNKTHPLKTNCEGKPSGVLIDYNIATLMLPMIIVGAMCGVVV